MRHVRPVAEVFRSYIAQHHETLTTLLRTWDEDGDGLLSNKEFRDGWRVLELDANLPMEIPRAEIDELYREMDIDGVRARAQRLPINSNPKNRVRPHSPRKFTLSPPSPARRETGTGNIAIDEVSVALRQIASEVAAGIAQGVRSLGDGSQNLADPRHGVRFEAESPKRGQLGLAVSRLH